MKPTPPIGHWLKKADEVLTASIDEAQRENGLARLDWQVLNVIKERGFATRDQVAAMLQPFADPATIIRVIQRLVERGVVEREPPEDRYSLSPRGRELHEKALASQTEVRARAMRDINAADFATTVRVLQKIVENLES